MLLVLDRCWPVFACFLMAASRMLELIQDSNPDRHLQSGQLFLVPFTGCCCRFLQKSQQILSQMKRRGFEAKALRCFQ